MKRDSVSKKLLRSKYELDYRLKVYRMNQSLLVDVHTNVAELHGRLNIYLEGGEAIIM